MAGNFEVKFCTCNECVKFRNKIPNDRSENGEQFRDNFLPHPVCVSVTVLVDFQAISTACLMTSRLC